MSSLNSDEAVILTVQCVPCSLCLAKEGEPCFSVKTGRKWKCSTHSSRRTAMRAWRKVRANYPVYKQRREEIASRRTSRRSNPLPEPDSIPETKPN